LRTFVPILYFRCHAPTKLSGSSINYLDKKNLDVSPKDVLFSYGLCLRKTIRKPKLYKVVYTLISSANPIPTIEEEVFEEKDMGLLCEFMSISQRIFEPVEIDALLFEGKNISEEEEERLVKKWITELKAAPPI